MIDEVLVIVPLKSGVADLTVLHEPAVSIKLSAAQGGPRTVTLQDRIDRANGIPPYEWPSVCGVVGVVYRKGGPLEYRPMCESCSVTLLELGPRVDDERSVVPLADATPTVVAARPGLSLSPGSNSAKEAA